MDFFKQVGNWFRGAFNGDDEEKKRRQQQQAQQARPQQPKPQVQKVPQLFGQKAPDALSTEKKPKPVVQPPVAKPQPVVAPAPRPTPAPNPAQTTEQLFKVPGAAVYPAPAPAATPEQIKEKQRQHSELVAFGKFRTQPKQVYLSHDEIKAAQQKNQELSRPKGLTPLDVATEIAKAPATVATSLANEFVVKPATNLATGLRDQVRSTLATKDVNVRGNDALAASDLKEIDRAEKAGEITKQRANELRQKTQAANKQGKEQFAQAQKGYKQQYGEDMKTPEENLGKFASGTFDLGTLGIGEMVTKFAAKAGLKAVEGKGVGEVFNAVKDEVEKRLGRELNPTEAVELSREARNRLNSIKEPAVEPVKEAATQAEQELLDIANSKNPNMPAIERKRAQEILDAQKSKEAPTPNLPQEGIDRPAIEHKRDIERVIASETEKFNRFVNSNPGLTQQQLEAAQQAAKERVIKLTNELKASREASLNAVEGQAEQVAQDAQKQADMVQEATDNRTKAVTPKEGEATPAPQGDAEAQANDAYARFDDEAGISTDRRHLSFLEGEQGLEKLAGNRTMDELVKPQGFRLPTAINRHTQGAVADAISDTAGKAGGKLLASQNPLLSFFGHALNAVNKKATLSNAEKTLVEQVRGRRGGVGNLRQQVVENIEKPLANMPTDAVTAAKERVFSAFEAYNNGDAETALKLIKSFTPEERAYFDGVRELNQLRNNLNRATMDAGVIDRYDNGMHMPRLYDQEAFTKEFSPEDIEAYAMSQNKALDLNPSKRRKQLEDISEELRGQMLRDPAQASAIRTEIALHNKAVSDYSARLGMLPDAVSDTARKGFLQIPEQARYGEAAGKWVRRDLAEPMLSGDDRFKSVTYQAVNTLLDRYQGSVMGKIENGLRKVLTVYNPATRLGNRTANLTQGAMAGFNLPEMAVAQQHYINVLKKGGDEWTRLAHTFGAIDNNEALGRFSGAVSEPTKGLFVGARQRATESYADVDTAAKVAMFKWQVQRGSSPEEAARFVNRALPNIGNSGEIYSFFSRLPVLGTPFRAIQPEVLRSLGSTMSRNTVPFLVAMTTYTTLQNMSWDGIPEEERKQVQERFGSGQTPFAGINKFFGEQGIPADKVLPSSWSFNAAGIPGIKELFGTDPDTGERPIVDVDPRRLMGMYSINLGGDSSADGIIDQVSKASPVNLPVGYNDGKVEFQPQNLVGSRLFAPLWQAAIDRDFRGKSVQSPERTNVNVVDPATGKPLDTRDDPLRAAEYVLRSWFPQVTDVTNLKDANDGKENFYGQKMNLPQAIGRLFGLKGEQFTKGDLQDMRDTERYFQDKGEIDKQLEGMSPNEQTAWKRLTGYDKLNEKKPNQFGTESWVKAPVYDFSEDKWKDYAANPRLYELMMEKKQQDAERDGTPIQPEFDGRLSAEFRRQLIQNKMVAPGDDAELDQRMYSSPEWDYYQKLKDAYKVAAKAYYKSDDQDFTDELVKHQDAKFPEKPDLLKQYSAAYSSYLDGKRDKPVFTDEMKALKQQYNQQTFNWTNAERAARGLPAITWDMWNNPTFGFDETPSGFSGYGGRGGYGGGGGDTVNSLGRLTNFSNDIKGYAPVEAQALPDLQRMFAAVQANKGSSRQKPRLGASSRGQ